MKNNTIKQIERKYNSFNGMHSFNHRKINLRNSPQIICLEVTNACNLKCPICPMNTGIVKRKKTFMSKEQFKKIVDKYQKYMSVVSLSHHGESLLHPDLTFFVRYLHEYGIKSSITTNATLLTEKMSKMLLENKLDYIMFSFDSMDKKVYESIRVGAIFEKTLENIKTFLELKNKMRATTHVCIRTINMDATKGGMEDFVSYFKKMTGVNVIEINEINTWGGRIDRHKFITDQSEGIRKDCFCLQPWTTTIINSECGVFACNNHEDKDFGNLKQYTLEKIWNNEEYQNLRKSIFNSTLKGTICERCDYVNMGAYSENPNTYFPFTKKLMKYATRKVIMYIGRKENKINRF